MAGRRHGGVKDGDGAPVRLPRPKRATQSKVRERQPSPAVDDDEPGPTKIQPPRPPSRSLLEGDLFGAPTGLQELPSSFPGNPNDDLTRVKSPKALMRELEEAEAAPTKVRHAAHGQAAVLSGAMPDPCAPDSDPVLDSIPPPQPEAGENVEGLTIGGRCQLGPAFARGGMATVHLGRWQGAGGFAKTVAVKRLHRHFATDPAFVRMLLDEARVVARIRHGNVTSVVDVIEQDAELFIVMDYVHGVTLAHLVRQMKRRGERMPIPIAMRIASGILHGLQAAHDATDEVGRPLCVIHRDVSPENVMVGADGYAQIIDFGIARAFGRSTKSVDGQIKGKLRYCSPEQLRGEELGPGCDIYAASNVLWEILCGRQLYRGENAGAVVYEILNSEVPRPSVVRPGVSEACDEIVLRGLHPDKNSRWMTAADMAEALERATSKASHREVGDWVKSVARSKLALLHDTLQAVENLPALPEPEPVEPDPAPSAPPPSSVAPAPEPTSRRPWAVIGGVVAVGAIAFGAVASGVIGQDAPNPAPKPPADEPQPPTTVFVPVPVPVPAVTSTPTVAPAEEPPPPEPSASAAPSDTPPPFTGKRSVWPRTPKPPTTPKPWIPDDI